MILMLMLQHDHVALYFGTFFFGLFLSSVTPSALSLAEQYIDVTRKYSFYNSCLMLVSCDYMNRALLQT